MILARPGLSALVCLCMLLPVFTEANDNLQGKTLFFTEKERRRMELVEAPLQRDEPKPANSDSKPQRQATVELRFRGSLIVGDVVREFWQISQSAKKKVFSRLLVPKPGDFSSDGKNTSSGRFTYKDGWVEQDQTLSIQKSSAKTGQ